jgi:protein associated with RNAse G/E
LPKQFQTEQHTKVLEMCEYLDKQYKEKYIGFQREYLSELKQLLSQLNQWIDKQVRPLHTQAQTRETVAKYKGGIVFPFD